jgi:hypothetical protein
MSRSSYLEDLHLIREWLLRTAFWVRDRRPHCHVDKPRCLMRFRAEEGVLRTSTDVTLSSSYTQPDRRKAYNKPVDRVGRMVGRLTFRLQAVEAI